MIRGSGHPPTCSDGEVPSGSEAKSFQAYLSYPKKQVAGVQALLRKGWDGDEFLKESSVCQVDFLSELCGFIVLMFTGSSHILYVTIFF